MSEQALEFQAQVVGVRSRVDRSITVTLSFGEDQAEAAQQFMQHIMGMCHGAVVFVAEAPKAENGKRGEQPEKSRKIHI